MQIYQNLSWLVKAYKEPVPIGCTGLVYLHTWKVDFMENAGKYTDYSNRSYGIKVIAFQEVVNIFFCPGICVLLLVVFGSKLPWRRNCEYHLVAVARLRWVELLDFLPRGPEVLMKQEIHRNEGPQVVSKMFLNVFFWLDIASRVPPWDPKLTWAPENIPLPILGSRIVSHLLIFSGGISGFWNWTP